MPVQMAKAAWTGENWRGEAFTDFSELIGRTGDDTKDPLFLSATKEEPSKGIVGWSTLSSFMLSTARTFLPIPLENTVAALAGEMEGITSMGKSAGFKLGAMQSYTPCEKKVHEALQHMVSIGTPESRALNKAKTDVLKFIIRDKDVGEFVKASMEFMLTFKLSQDAANAFIQKGLGILTDPKYGLLKYQFNEVAKQNFSLALQAFEKAHPDEKRVLLPVLFEHLNGVVDLKKVPKYVNRIQEAMK